MRLHVTPRFPGHGMKDLKSFLFWDPTKLYDEHLDKDAELVGQCLSDGLCRSKFQPDHREHTKSSTYKNFFNDSTFFNISTFASKASVFFDCWYNFTIYVVKSKSFWGVKTHASRSWIFHVPDCIKVDKLSTCGCSYFIRPPEKNHESLYVDVLSSNNKTSVARVNWKKQIWQEDIIMFQVEMVDRDSKFYKSFVKTVKVKTESDKYSVNFTNLLTRNEYDARLTAIHSHHCHHKERYIFKFTALAVCQWNMSNNCRNNSKCKQIPGTIKYNCPCNDGFFEFNQTCTPENVTEIKEKKDKKETKDSRILAIVAGIVPAVIVIIVLFVAIIIWLRYFHKKRMNFMAREFDIALGTNVGGTLTNPYDLQHPMVVALPEQNGKEINLLYMMKEGLEMPENLRVSLRLLELPGERIRRREMIGRGAFGEVYLGEAEGVNDSPGWTTVAIKTLTVAVHKDDVHDFMREIELMADIGKHKNVIQMFGCCIKSRPICLVLEYAPGGNLVNYLRALKKKCKEIAAAQVYAFMEAEKQKFEKFFDPGEMPSFTDDLYNKTKGNEVKQAEAINVEIASRIKNELRAALDPKELESFARQIASGMEHVSQLGIVHRDLAARNILLGENKVLKISDFGLSREGSTYIKKTAGKIPFRWLSIEAIRERLYSTASDVWAFGIVLWEICTLGDIPYPTVSDKDLEQFLMSGQRLDKVNSCTDEIYTIMLKCWSHVPEDRPSFTELSKELWDLEHKGNTYVNVESLMKQSMEDDHGNGNGVDKKNNNKDGDPLQSDVAGENTAFDNPGFSLGEEDLTNC
ncbi:fibroblast growth factor receptor-like isoform X2 [Xenia sp. Carnegie-2017]|nr:fibroblast growth factor receptor-like isoform X2 [Xenia sp. Carnegie-2017]